MTNERLVRNAALPDEKNVMEEERVSVEALVSHLGRARLGQLRALARDTPAGRIYFGGMSLPTKDQFDRAYVAVPAHELLAILDTFEGMSPDVDAQGAALLAACAEKGITSPFDLEIALRDAQGAVG